MWRQVVPLTPRSQTSVSADHPYAQAAAQLNRLIRQGHSFSGHERNACFLNVGGERFANASGVSGFAFDDDGRAVVECDWDRDGDLDFWVANRTAPQLRFLRNDLGGGNHFVAFRLVGTESNRDAIGARVELTLAGDGGVLIQSIRAGEGFLSQSSTVVQFGLGQESRISRIDVRWPNGQRETFSVPDRVDASFELREGTGISQVWQRPPTPQRLESSWHHLPPSSLATHNLLTQPCPLPPLEAVRHGDETIDLTAGDGRPRLINLWATWCEPCLNELTEWSAHREELEAAGLSVFVVSVDEPSSSADAMLRKLAIPFEAVIATESMIEVLQLTHDTLYDHHRRLPVPTSLLLDGHGCLAALYKGPVSADQILRDVQRVQDAHRTANSTLPFGGRWIGEPAPHRLGTLVSRLWEIEMQDAALSLTDRMNGDQWIRQKVVAHVANASGLRRQKSDRDASEQLLAALALEPNHPDANMQLGILLAEYERPQQAVTYLAKAVEHALIPRADFHANYGIVLRQLGQLTAAEHEFRRALQIDDTTTEAQASLGLLLVSQGRLEEAAACFRSAVELDAANTDHRINLAMAMAGLGRFDDAIQQLQAALEQDESSLAARIYLGEVYAQAGRDEDAISHFRQVLAVQPDASRVWLRLAQVAEQFRRYAEALEAYGEVDRLAAGDPRVQIQIAWLLATVPEPLLRDGQRSVAISEPIATSTIPADPFVLNVLAAAYAEVGQFERAVEVTERAIRLVETPADAETLAEYRERLDFYRRGVPFRLPPRAP